MRKINLDGEIGKLQRLLGRKTMIQVYVESSTDCTECGYNPVTRQATNPKCGTCGGKGRIIVEKRIKLPALVQRNSDRATGLSGGINDETSIQLYVDYRTVMNFRNFLNGRCLLYVDNTKYEIVDSIRTGIYDNDMIVYTCQRVEGVE